MTGRQSEGGVTRKKSVGGTFSEAEQRQMYDAVLSNTPDFVYVIDLNYRFRYANDALLKMWGRTAEDAIGKTLIELGYEQWHADMHNKEIDQIIATKKAITGEVPFTGTMGKRIYEYIFSPIFGDGGKVLAIAGTTRDVTERKKTEEALRISEEHRRVVLEAESEAREHLDLILDSAEDYAIISADVKGVIVSWNKGAERIFRYSRGEALGKSIQTILPLKIVTAACRNMSLRSPRKREKHTTKDGI